MDTRTKIVPRQEAEARLHNREGRWVTGQFDPLLAEHVQWLEKARKSGQILVVEVTNPKHPLLAQRARAELVAALSMVDLVVLGGRAAGPSDADVTERFVEHVLRRHQQESPR